MAIYIASKVEGSKDMKPPQVVEAFSRKLQADGDDLGSAEFKRYLGSVQKAKSNGQQL